MDYKYKRSQIFAKRVKAPRYIIRKIYDCTLSFTEYIRYELDDKVPLSCLAEKDRKFVEKFGMDTLKKIDLESFDLNPHLKDVLMDMDIDFNSIKNKDLSYCLLKDISNKNNITDSELKEFVSKYGELSSLIMDDGDIYSFIREYSDMQNIEEKNKYIIDYLSNYVKRNRNYLSENKTKMILKYMSFKEFFEIFTNYHDVSSLADELNELPDDYIFNMPFPFNILFKSDVLRFVDKYGLKNIVDFDNECGHYFSSNNCYMLENMFELYIHNCDREDDPKKKVYKMSSIDENGIYVEKPYTKDEFYESMRRMIIYGSSSEILYTDSCPDYSRITGDFREKNPDLFLSEDAPDELNKSFYTHTLTLSNICDYPEYNVFLEGKNLWSCFKFSFYVYIHNKGKHLYEFLSEIVSNRGVLDFITEYGNIIDTISNNRNQARCYDIDFSDVSNIDQVKDLIDKEFVRLLIVEKINYPEKISKKLKKNKPSFFISEDAPKEMQEAFYNRKNNAQYILDNPNYQEYLKDIDLELIYTYMPFHTKNNGDTSSINLVGLIKKTFNKEEAFDIMLKYGKYIESVFAINRLNNLALNQEFTMEEFIEQIESCILDCIIKEKMKYDDKMPDHFKEKNPTLFLNRNAPKELQEAFYNRKINAQYILDNPNYQEYLKDIDLELIYTYMPFHTKNNGDTPSINLVGLIKKTFNKEEAFDIMLKYGKYIESVFFINKLNNLSLNKKFTMDEFIEQIESCILDCIIEGKMKYDDKMPDHFKEKNPTLFLNSDVPKDIFYKFYVQKLTIEDFNSNPQLLNMFKNTNIVYGFPYKYAWIANLFNKNSKTFNLDCLKIIIEYSKIQNPVLEEIFKNYLLNNTDSVFTDKKDIIVKVLNRLEYSNAIELYSFKESLATMVLATDDPLKYLDKIEEVFMKNNLPLFGKMFLIFQMLYPNFSKKTDGTYEIFSFESNSRMAPQLKNDTLPQLFPGLDSNTTRFAIIFNDLLRISYRSNERSLMDYLDNIEKGNEIYLKLINNNYDMTNLSQEELSVLEIFVSHLQTMYYNTQKDINNEELDKLPLNEKIKKLGIIFKPTSQHDLKDRIVRSYCFTAGCKSFDELKNLSLNAGKELEERSNRILEEINRENKFSIHQGDLVRSIGFFEILGSTLEAGNVCKEHLSSFIGKSNSDTTPLDADLSLISDDSSIYNAIKNSPTGFGFGNIYIVFRKDNPNLNLTRDKNGNLTESGYDPTKIELFGSQVAGNGYESHFGARTGFAFTDIDVIIYKKKAMIDDNKPYDEDGNVNYLSTDKPDHDDLPTIKFELAKKGFYVPIVDFSGKLIFTKKEFNELRDKMQGLSYLGCKNYTLSHNLDFPEMKTIYDSLNEDSTMETDTKRKKISDLIYEIVSSYGYNLRSTISNDLTPGTVELIDTGSTGRNTNVVHDGDFDFFMRLDAEIIRNPSLMQEFKDKIIKKFSSISSDFKLTDVGDLRFKSVKIDEETTVDIDISFGVKTNKIDYSSDICLKDRLSSIKSQYSPEEYKKVVSNIIFAKQILKENGAYKPRRGREPQGGLGGVGVENWILQNGGSFIDAAKSFLKAAEGKTFTQFCECYQIWDFGKNHFSARKGGYLHDNFVQNNMNEDGYNKMVKCLKKYFLSNDYGKSHKKR